MPNVIKETKEQPDEKKTEVKSDTKSSCGCGCTLMKIKQ